MLLQPRTCAPNPGKDSWCFVQGFARGGGCSTTCSLHSSAFLSSLPWAGGSRIPQACMGNGQHLWNKLQRSLAHVPSLHFICLGQSSPWHSILINFSELGAIPQRSSHLCCWQGLPWDLPVHTPGGFPAFFLGSFGVFLKWISADKLLRHSQGALQEHQWLWGSVSTWPNDTQMGRCILFHVVFSQKKTHQEEDEGKNKGEKEELPSPGSGWWPGELPAIWCSVFEGKLGKFMDQKSIRTCCKLHRRQIWECIEGIESRLSEWPFSTYPCPLLMELLRLGKTNLRSLSPKIPIDSHP